MKYIQTTACKKILSLQKRLKIIQGGSSAGKTLAILLIFIDKAQARSGYLSSVVSETVPHLKRGAIRDFLNIMEGHGYYDEKRWNKTDFIYTFETGSKIEFFSAESSDKVRGPRRNGDLFMNECNNMGYETYRQLAIRTEGDIFLDYNPVAEFWVNEELIDKKKDNDFIIVTYKDNEGLPQVIVDEIESGMDDKNFWDVYGLGITGSVAGQIYKDWAFIESVPHEARLLAYGLDFGYKNDPTAICAIYYFNGGYIVDEITYQKGLLNNQIADLFKALPTAPVIADSAEPKSIDEMRLYGLTMIPATKGKGSVSQGIAFVQSQRMSITKNSTWFIKSYRNYLNIIDKDGKTTNEPSHKWSDGMDAVRYGMQIKGSLEKPIEYIQPAYQRSGFDSDGSVVPIERESMDFTPKRR